MRQLLPRRAGPPLDTNGDTKPQGNTRAYAYGNQQGNANVHARATSD